MRHRVYGKHLGRDKNQRTALFKNLVQSLILWEKIETTQAKAKAIKGLVDKIINQAKTPATRRLVSQFLVKKETQEKLIKDIAPRLKSRTSGYTSVVKLGRRLGDGTMMVSMRLLTEEKVSQGERVSQVPQVRKEEEKPRDTSVTRQSRGTSKKEVSK
ncbi:MAG: ribosomal protein L17 [uncultured bacterium]|uniref:50S ribosomal protein L17 n=4 Tax=Candidatus Daviesiibacteriota TaxID=1752718 RepID=A0A0G0I2T5_9BACT|nr:MAG: ribosomal protein L17 [uncultured bacterium]KKQ10426.1 MAG: 50S ribosomal protein L17 [Candidatus Daviesbacteria bacterium GW2011_GWB1_36_5]KKQ15806.1 MAG: 50S ribosomal protein L17 [Candidatus Daviesbacteria bacterium GW2011_GWA1_36_8]OGE16585.1 MAG: 50S ribosomal protein L17 [Candidatus Daviesbacteria bacterium RIFCSPHIGHO2_01_FULL_36_37]OGE31734.1 MAG: 50S ribosomal protein L17 [Candidatus Daviesbacteria bacterium RIFCSPHIGHO2_02_FULL_37_9]OGE34668.1 MAG: 50S ribosomal protein L17 [